MSLKYDLMRKMRIQYKTGYITEMPIEYTFMRRYPPVLRDGKPTVKNVNYRTLPFVRLYEKAVSKNPLFEDEKIYPAYWQSEPQAMTLARKQYQLMMKGIDEEKAYEEAYAHAKSMESGAYESLLEIQNTIRENGARLPFAMDEDTIDELDEWQEKLEDTPYDDLPLHEKGKLDYFIQSKLLNWTEMERERRNRDPLFVFQFEGLRAAMFPTIRSDRIKEIKSNRSIVRDSLAKQYNLSSVTDLAQKPFYFKDYFNFFHLASERPDINDWNPNDRSALMKWIAEVLAARDMQEEMTTQEYHDYLDALRARFFPQFCYPERADKFSLPALADVKMMLYENGVGYRDAQGQLFVKRFYRLPALLFPEETEEALPVKDMIKSSENVSSTPIKDILDDVSNAEDGFVSNETLMLEQILSSSNKATNKERTMDDDLDDLDMTDVAKKEEIPPEDVEAIEAMPVDELRRELKRILKHISKCDMYEEKEAMKERYASRVYHIANAIILKQAGSENALPEFNMDSNYDEITNRIVDLVNAHSEGLDIADHPYATFFSEADIRSGNHRALVQSLKSEEKEKLLFAVNELMRAHKAGISVRVLRDLKDKYDPQVGGVLEEHRRLWLDFVSQSSFDALPPREDAFESARQRRLDVQVLQRAKAAVAYEQKEGARRQDEWKRRRVETRGLFPINR